MKKRTAEPITVKYDTSRLKCSFCGLPQSKMNKLIVGKRKNICDQCVKWASDKIADENGEIAQ
jgi:ATP-dependent Clp protease ATP-binding subunit ClpX